MAAHLIGVPNDNAADGRPAQLLGSVEVRLRIWAPSVHIIAGHHCLKDMLQASGLQRGLQSELGRR